MTKKTKKPVADINLARVAHLLDVQRIRLDRVSVYLTNGKQIDGQRELAELRGTVDVLRKEIFQ